MWHIQGHIYVHLVWVLCRALQSRVSAFGTLSWHGEVDAVGIIGGRKMPNYLSLFAFEETLSVIPLWLTHMQSDFVL